MILNDYKLITYRDSYIVHWLPLDWREKPGMKEKYNNDAKKEFLK